MDAADSDLENKCELLMNVVVESRKRFGKMCVEYEQKTSLMENKMLNLQVETISNLKFTPKYPIPAIDSQDYEDLEDFSKELLERSKRMEELRKRVKDTQDVVSQLKAEGLGKRLREPLTGDVLMARAKGKEDS